MSSRGHRLTGPTSTPMAFAARPSPWRLLAARSGALPPAPFCCRPLTAAAPAPSRAVQARVFNGSGGGGNNHLQGQDFVEVKVESVRQTQGGSNVVYLKLMDAKGYLLPVHIGDAEAAALLKEIHKQKSVRPLTHDLTRNALHACGVRVSKIRITELVNNTYYSRVFLRLPGDGQHEVDVDARPSDAINLAVRCGAPIYVSRKIAEMATPLQPEPVAAPSASDMHAEVARSVREALASFEDPTVVLQLQKELAVKAERFEDAFALQQSIHREMVNNKMLRLVVAMEAALQDHRFEDASSLLVEYRATLATPKQPGAAQQSHSQQRSEKKMF